MRSQLSLVLFALSSLGHAHALPEGPQIVIGGPSSPRIGRDWQVGQKVQTSSGPVQGHAASDATAVSEYLGIPYAQPPVGKLRFQPPVKFTGSDELDGSKFGFSCVGSNSSNEGGDALNINKERMLQLDITEAGLYLLQLAGESASPPSEDCLTLNVWTKPQVGEAKKAVLLWIHGGGYTGGSSSSAWYNGQFIADQEDVVIVSINYRLSLFGFPGSPTTPANLGILDQRMAVEWVRDNVAAFGGDPNRIVLFGQSAGGGSVDHHSWAWADDPIVSGYIPQSGTALSFGALTAGAAANTWFNVSTIVGCGNSTSSTPDAVLECMLGKSAFEISAAVPLAVVDPASGSTLPIGPSVDGTIVFPPADYSVRSPAPLPVLVGVTDFEPGLFRLFNPDAPELIWPILQQAVFNCPAAARAKIAAEKGHPVWRYRYFGVFPNTELTIDPPSGAWHACELTVLFGTTPTAILNNTAAELEIGAYLRRAWSTFAKDPVHGLERLEGEGGGWPRYSAQDRTLVQLAFDNKTGPNLAIGNDFDGGCADLATGTRPLVMLLPQ